MTRVVCQDDLSPCALQQLSEVSLNLQLMYVACRCSQQGFWGESFLFEP